MNDLLSRGEREWFWDEALFNFDLWVNVRLPIMVENDWPQLCSLITDGSYYIMNVSFTNSLSVNRFLLITLALSCPWYIYYVLSLNLLLFLFRQFLNTDFIPFILKQILKLKWLINWSTENESATIWIIVSSHWFQLKYEDLLFSFFFLW